MSGAGSGNDATRTGIHAHADFPPGSVLADRFRIESILGVGGMGVVYRATDLTLGVPVALKLLRPELAHREGVFERFRQELLLARQVSSPRVVRIHDLATHDGRWLISMDYVDGESLDHHIDRTGPLAVDDALRLARQIAEGLAADRQRPRDAEITDVGVAARVEQDVGRLEVAMHHALGMRRGQALGDLSRQAQRFVNGEWPGAVDVLVE
jgi:serine/threonine protein kinase